MPVACLGVTATGFYRNTVDYAQAPHCAGRSQSGNPNMPSLAYLGRGCQVFGPDVRGAAVRFARAGA
jgi:hypothetical protein